MTAPQRLRPRNAPAGRAILGGSFNPPHVGHLRLAVEVREALGDLVTGVDLVPCAVPPHKDASDLLPFGLRAALVEACIAGLPWLACNRLEGRRQGPSYTWDTLSAYRQAAPGTDLYFILGSPDFAQLPLWRRGTELPRLCHFVVVPRDGHNAQDFASTARHIWPDARERAALLPGCPCMALPGGGLAHFLAVPRLSVSSSQVRHLWLTGHSVDFLLPEAALRMLREHAGDIREHWRNRQGC